MLSIIIPLYNKQDFILATLNSVLSQRFTSFEVIIVNDGSTDKSLEILSKIQDRRIKIISINNSGVSEARNVGLKNAKYSWVAFLDADDLWNTTYLNEAIKLINNYPDIYVFATNYYKMYNRNNTLAVKQKSGIIDSYFNQPCIFSSSIILKKVIFDKIGFFEPRLKYGEDIHMWIRVGYKYKIFFNNNPLVYYRMQDHQKNSKSFMERDINCDLVSVINDLEIAGKEWEIFKRNYVLKYLRAYYVYDNHLEEVKKILKLNLRGTRLNLLYLFYIIPRFMIKGPYKLFFRFKYS